MQTLLIYAILLPALFMDLKDRRVPNLLILTGLWIAIVYQIVWGNLGQGLLAGFFAFCFTVPFFFIGEGLGAGDVKLLVVLATITNFQFFLVAFTYTAVIGGILAILLNLFKGKLAHLVSQTRFALLQLITFHEPILSKEQSIVLPYVVPIFVGTTLAVLKGGHF